MLVLSLHQLQASLDTGQLRPTGVDVNVMMITAINTFALFVLVCNVPLVVFFLHQILL